MASFISKYKTQIISIITAISALALSLTSLGGEVARICELVIAIDAVLIAVLKTGFDNKFVDSLVALLKLLQEQYNITPKTKKEEQKIASSPNPNSEASTLDINQKIRVVNADGSVSYIESKPKLASISSKDVFIEDTVEQLTDEQLKDLVESYLHNTKIVKGANNSEEKTKE